MKMIPADSRAIAQHGYDEKAKTLSIAFRGGKTYTYHGVSQAAYDEFKQAQSLGKHFATHISGKYQVS